MKPLNIAMISHHGCIRMHKMAIPLIERGHNVHLIANRMTPYWEQYKTFNLCTDTEQNLEAMKLLADSGRIDVFHAHNEPSWYVTALKEITDTPVILDVHDSYIARSTPEEADAVRSRGEMHIRETSEERNNFQMADGLVFPGDEFRAEVSSEYKLEQPALTLQSMLPKRWYAYKAMDWHGGLVYEGKVNLPGDEVKGPHTGFEYCEYTDLAKRCHAMGMDFHLYARSDKKFVEHYKDIALLHQSVEYEQLIGTLTRHDWGLVGNVKKTREWDMAMPNKLFEYTAASVPVAVMNADPSAKFVKETGMGIVVDGPEELGERWKEHREVRKKLVKERQNWSMNAHIHKLEEFYRGFC